MRFSMAACAGLMALAFCGVSQAQNFPTRPITVVVPYPAGGGVDVSIRRYADVVTRTIGQRVIIDNKPGGGGVIGAMAVKQAAPNGHTLFLAHQGTHSIMHHLQQIEYDPIKDFQPITLLYYWPAFLTVPASLPVTTVAELVELARRKPGGLTYGSQGVGSTGHILGAMLQMKSGAPLVHVPYPGGTPMNLDLLQSRLDIGFSTYNFMNQYVQEGKMRFLAVASEQRSHRAPDVPTMAELGYPGVDADTWLGLLAPASTPPQIVKKLNEEFVKASVDPALVEALGKQGIEAKATTPEEFGIIIARDAEKFGPVLKAAGVTVN